MSVYYVCTLVSANFMQILMNVASTLMVVLIIVLTSSDPICVVVGLATHSALTDILVKVCKLFTNMIQ